MSSSPTAAGQGLDEVWSKLAVRGAGLPIALADDTLRTYWVQKFVTN